MPLIRASLLLPRTAFDVAILRGHIDGAPELRHSQTVETTQFPIGKNAYVTDHAIVRPLTFGGRFICSNRVTRQGKAAGLQRQRIAWGAMRSLFLQRNPVQVVTAHATYTEMLLTSLARDENKDTGTALIVDFQMQQIQRIESLVYTPPGDEEPVGDGSETDGTLDRGYQPLTEATYNERSGVLLDGIVPLANVVNQRFETTLGVFRAQIEVSWHDNGDFWEIAVSDSTGIYSVADKLYAGNIIKLANEGGVLEVIANTDNNFPPEPSETGPWGEVYKLQWRFS